MKYIIMADGDMKRWDSEYKVPKHLVKIRGETLLGRLVRQLKEVEPNAQIIITSHKKNYDVKGAFRYEPKSNELEIDRFTWELIEDDICFLYGDTYYSDDAIKTICRKEFFNIHFVGTKESIIAVLVKDSQILKEHIKRVKELYKAKKIKECRGWQVYLSFVNKPLDKIKIYGDFTVIDDCTCGFNDWQQYENFIKKEKSLNIYV